MMDPFFLAKSTRDLSWSYEAHAPVGLLGLQKKMRSVLAVFEMSGKKPFSLRQFMYSMFLYWLVSSLRRPVAPMMTLEST